MHWKEEEEENAYRILVGKPEGKGPLRSPSCRRENNIKMDLPEIASVGMHWTNLDHDRNQWSALMNSTEAPG
jgi:hypothetical protein